MTETLVLTAALRPLRLVSWQRAISLVFAGKVEVLESFDERPIRAISVELRRPAVVRYLRRVKLHVPLVRFSRENLWLRDDGRCQYCGVRLARSEFTFDHVLPRAQGGRTCWENIVVACVPCNRDKAARTPAEAGLVLARQPARPASLPTTRWLLPADRTPSAFRPYLRDVAFWHGALDEEGAPAGS